MYAPVVLILKQIVELNAIIVNKWDHEKKLSKKVDSLKAKLSQKVSLLNVILYQSSDKRFLNRPKSLIIAKRLMLL